MIRYKRSWWALAVAAGLFPVAAMPARALEVRGPIQSAARNSLRVSNRVVRLDENTVLQDTNGGALGVEELKPGVWVEVELDGQSGSAGRIRANVVR